LNLKRNWFTNDLLRQYWLKIFLKSQQGRFERRRKQKRADFNVRIYKYKFIVHRMSLHNRSSSSRPGTEDLDFFFGGGASPSSSSSASSPEDVDKEEDDPPGVC
jgi:hypothetical protein